ncbi:exonuclease domain-containing protein [Halobacillus sp. K22]|uniref:exonuclease domain-containing protein n=1 Tax=Halobacillus sp. K22 TaxID=3457431 RepID=UPI003FCEC40A
MNFVALDFETANSSRGSVCSIGLVEYENNEVKHEYYRLVKPRKNYFSPKNISIHGITKNDIADAYEFDILWKNEIQPMVEGKFLVAHNAQFDMGVLRAVLDEYRLPYPLLAYNCTLNISKKTWELPRYNLKSVSNHIGFRFNHHHALEDAQAAAHILIKACEELKAENTKDLVEKTQTTNGMMYDQQYEPARLNKKQKAKKPESINYVAASREIDHSHPFYGASFAFTGRLTAMNREKAVQTVANLGGYTYSTVESTTNYLIVGSKTYDQYLNGKKNSKLERTETLLSQGHSIEILPENDFLNYL